MSSPRRSPWSSPSPASHLPTPDRTGPSTTDRLRPGLPNDSLPPPPPLIWIAPTSAIASKSIISTATRITWMPMVMALAATAGDDTVTATGLERAASSSRGGSLVLPPRPGGKPLAGRWDCPSDLAVLCDEPEPVRTRRRRSGALRRTTARAQSHGGRGPWYGAHGGGGAARTSTSLLQR